MRNGRDEMRISQFQMKDIINIYDGRKLGNITDFEINLPSGRIEAIIIQSGNRVLGLFGKEEEITILWKQIVKIGEDVIIVKYKNENTTTQQRISAIDT